MRFVERIKTLVLARPTGITPECAGLDRCRPCDDARARAAEPAHTPWIRLANGAWAPTPLRIKRRTLLFGTVSLIALRTMLPELRWVQLCEAAPQPYEGYGTTTPGGSGQGIVHVTVRSGSGAGSLPAAVAGGASNRIVVFDQNFNGANQIELPGNTFYRGHHITITGATPQSVAPPTIHGAAFVGYPGAHDVILTYLRSREATRGDGGGDNDGFGFQETSYNIVCDHLSVWEPGDGCIDIVTNSHDCTIQYSILIKRDEASGSGPTLIAYGAQRVSVHHNLYNGRERNPACSVGAGGPQPTDLVGDIRCNLAWDWGYGGQPPTSYGNGIAVDAGQGGTYGSWANAVNNYCKTTGAPSLYGLGIEVDHNPGSVASRLYASGNVSGNGVSLTATGNQPALIGSPPAITEHDALTAAAYVLTCSGCRPLDAIDQGLVNTILANIGSTLPSVTCGGAHGGPSAPTNVQIL